MSSNLHSQPSQDGNIIRARRRIMRDGATHASDAPDGPDTAPELGREDSIPRITRTPSTFLRMRTDAYQEMGVLLQEAISSPTMMLLVFVPAGTVAGLLQIPDIAVFLLNFVALVPLAGLILYSILVFTKDHEIVGGLLRAVLGNATELALGTCALLQGKVHLIQGVMIGSILTYCLFVLGGSFLVASYGKKKEPFSKSRTSIMSSLVMSGSICLTIPTVIAIAVEERKSGHTLGEDNGDEVNSDTLFLSLATAVVQMVLFFVYLIFRFRTHNSIFPHNPNAPHLSQLRTNSSRFFSTDRSSSSSSSGHWSMGFVTLVTLTCTGICARNVVRSLTGAMKALGFSESFAALVLLPQAGSLVKAITIVKHTRSDDSALPGRMSRLDFAIRSIMTNVFDTELFILPVLVILGWAVGVPLKLSFGLFEAVILLMSIMTMTYLVQHGKTTYFEGIMLMGTYLSICIALFVRPEVTRTYLSSLGLRTL